MDNLIRIKKEFEGVFKTFDKSTSMKKILCDEVTIDHDESYLRQIYHYTKHDSHISSLLIKTIYAHHYNCLIDGAKAVVCHKLKTLIK